MLNEGDGETTCVVLNECSSITGNVEQDVERTLSQQQQDIISDAVVNQKVGRPDDLQLAPINLDKTYLILTGVHFYF